MNLLDSLLDAIVRLDGDALVVHVGEKPYVVTTSEASNEFRGPLAWGQVELSSRVLTLEAVVGMLGQILPLDQRAALDEYGATDYEVAAASDPAERFTIVAARGGDDIWLEVRRQSKQKSEPGSAEAAPDAERVLVLAGSHEGEAHSVHQPEGPIVASSAVSHLLPLMPPIANEEAIDAPEPELDDEIGYSLEQPEEESLGADDEEPFVGDHETIGSVAEIAEDQDWGDDVMTEGDLGDLLRASAGSIVLEESASVLEEAATAEPNDGFDLGALLASAAPVAEEAAWDPVVAAAVQEPGALALDDIVLVEAAPGALATTGIDPEFPATPASDDARVDFTTAAYEELAPSAGQVIPTVPFDDVATPAHPSVALAAGNETLAADERAAAAEEARAAAGVPGLAPIAGGGTAQPVRSMFKTVTSEEIEMFDNSRPDLSAPIFKHVAEQEAAGSLREAPLASVGADQEGDEEVVSAPRPGAVVLPLSRQRPDGPADDRGGVTAALQRLLRLAAARGAATVYVVAQSAPMVRVDGEFSVLDGEPTLTPAFVERLLAELTPRTRDGAASPAAEWVADVPEIGRVRCVTFRDHRGPGVIFRMVPPRAISADQLGLSAEVQALSTEADGLVLVAGGRGSGRSTLLTSFVDLVNRTRSDHVITTESHIEFVHENKRSFISQREVRGSAEALAAAVRAAIREEPDVLVIEDLRTPELVSLALEAAESGRLVFASVPAVSAMSAVERIIEMFPAERREKAQAALAGTLRGIVSQVVVRRLKGGRVAAREVLINTPEIAKLILEGKTSELPEALAHGRRHGMSLLAESLAALVREGTVHPSHAERKAPDTEQFLGILRRDGVDVQVAERLA